MSVKPIIQMLTQEERRTIINQMYELLETLGMKILSKEAREIYEKAGCTVEGEIVKMPRAIVESAVNSAPSCVNIYDRNGNLAMELGGTNTYFGSGPTCLNFLDARTGERRPSVKSDTAIAALVADALPNIDFVMSLTSINDVEPRDVHEFDALIRNTTKPIACLAFDNASLQTMIDMAVTVAGGADKLKDKPFMMVYSATVTPMILAEEGLDQVMMLARNNIPCIFTPGMLIGATTPVTMAGALSVGLCECVAGLVLGQLINPGAPFIIGPTGGPMDMQTMQFCYGAPEYALANCAAGELCQELGVPAYGGAGTTDSKTVDAQAAAEAAAQATLALFTGSNLVHNVGLMELGMLGSPLHMTMCDDIIGYCLRLHQGIPVNEEHLAKEDIINAGHGGDFLTTDLTLENWEEEFFQPKLYDRQTRDQWVAQGSKSMTQKAQDRLNSILDTHTSEALPDEVLKALDKLVEEASTKQ